MSGHDVLRQTGYTDLRLRLGIVGQYVKSSGQSERDELQAKVQEMRAFERCRR